MRLTILLLPVLLAAGCQTAGSRPATEVRATSAPADLAVLPVDDRTGHATSPVSEIRAAATHVLLDKGFSPLSQALVDRNYGGGVVAASALRLPESGVLELRVLDWRDRDALTHGRFTATLEAFLYDADGTLLAHLRGPGEMQVAPGDLAPAGDAERRSRLAAKAVEALLEPLPGPPPL